MLLLSDVLEALLAGSTLQFTALPGVELAALPAKAAWYKRVITEAVIDSRQAIPGSLFIALPGEHQDGHDFVSQAFERGAHVALVQRDLSARFQVLDLRKEALEKAAGSVQITSLLEIAISDAPICLWVDDSLAALQIIARHWRRKLDVRVIGITGSVGKSTTKELVAEVLEQRFRTLRNVGNLNNEIGLPLTLLRLGEGHQRAVLEMGFYVPGEIAFLCDLALPSIGVVTNIGTVHAERAGSQEIIARGKAELVQALPPAPQGVAVLNYDDPLVRPMAELTQARVIFYGLDSHADLWADHLESLGLEGIRFRLHYRNEALYIRVPLIGRHSVHTALRAAAVGLAEGLTWQEIIEGLHSQHTQLRLVAVRTESGALILDDTYNASPESTLAALNLLDELEGRKIAVLGDMLELGPYEAQGHEMVGVRAAEVVDQLVTVGERGRLIATAAQQSGLADQYITQVEDAPQAVEYLSSRLAAGDIVLVKGSHGMRMERIVSALEVG
jgi:UDP-N-acetylmuramoyl-tripeptide--D-alanyl-D-alanine ligase